MMGTDNQFKSASMRMGPMVLMTPRYGFLCANVARVLGEHVREHDLGRVLIYNPQVAPDGDPDPSRALTVCFYSYARMPRGRVPDAPLPAAPELVVEVHRAGESWRAVRRRVERYQDAGVLVVCVLEPEGQTLHAYSDDLPDQVMTADQVLSLPKLHADFHIGVRRLFEG